MSSSLTHCTVKRKTEKRKKREGGKGRKGGNKREKNQLGEEFWQNLLLPTTPEILCSQRCVIMKTNVRNILRHYYYQEVPPWEQSLADFRIPINKEIKNNTSKKLVFTCLGGRGGPGKMFFGVLMLMEACIPKLSKILVISVNILIVL